MSSEALELALALYRAPAQRFVLRDRELPPDIGQVIRLASGNAELLREEATRLREPESVILEAVRFYLQQVLFDPDADAYRVLGLASDAPHERVREHYHWLQRWLHPDRRGDDWDALYATRVNGAWNQLRSDTGRRAYDESRVATEPGTAVVHHPVGGVWMPIPAALPQRNWLRLAVLGVSLSSCVLLVAVLLREDPSPADWSGAGRSGVTAGEGSTAGAGSRFPHLRSPGRQPVALAASDGAGRSAAMPDSASGASSFSARHAVVTAAPSAATQIRKTAAAFAPPTTVRATAPELPQGPASVADSIGAGRAIPVKREGRHHRARPSGDVPLTVMAGIRTNPRSAAHLDGIAEPESAAAAISVSSPVQLSSAPTSATPRVRELTVVTPRAASHAGQHQARPTLPTVPTITSVQPPPAIDQSSASVSAAPRSAPPPVNPGDMVERIDLARQRVRELTAYFGGGEAALPARWLDAEGQVRAQSLRSSLYARNQLQSSAGFALESPNWYLAQDKVRLSATYRVRRHREQLEYGRFFVDMTWRGHAWQVSRVALEPSL